MFCRAVSIALVLTGTFGLAPTALAQLAPLQGNILGTDGRPLQGAEIRLEGKDKPSAPITATTSSHGRYLFAGLPAGVYRLSVLEGGVAKFSVNIKMRGEKARIDFDLSPSATKKIRNYVWVPRRTGSNLAGHWVEVERRSTPAKGLQ
jgi:Carboxypeptidase regulatory-like domain